MSKNRMETFFDGVVAIIITIMVLEMKVPHGEAIEALGPLVPEKPWSLYTEQNTSKKNTTYLPNVSIYLFLRMFSKIISDQISVYWISQKTVSQHLIPGAWNSIKTMT